MVCTKKHLHLVCFLTQDLCIIWRTSEPLSHEGHYEENWNCWLKWMNKLDEDVYIVYNSILIRFNFLQCHFFKCLPYKIPAGHKIFIIFFQYPDHSQSQIEDGYRKEITFLFSYLLIHCLYSCCGSLPFTIICCIVFTCVVDPWYLQLFADPWPL